MERQPSGGGDKYTHRRTDFLNFLAGLRVKINVPDFTPAESSRRYRL